MELTNDTKIVITMLSLGKNYTKDYTLRMIEDVLKMSDLDIYITTDCAEIIEELYLNHDRIKLNKINREDYKIRLPIGLQKAASDFNFNLRHLCLEPVKDLEDTVVIFTDCDNSFDWYDKTEVIEHLKSVYADGYDFLAPRNTYYWKNFVTEYKGQDKKECGIFWHKIHNYDLDLNDEKWYDAPMPAEYIAIFINNNGKLFFSSNLLIDNYNLEIIYSSNNQSCKIIYNLIVKPYIEYNTLTKIIEYNNEWISEPPIIKTNILGKFLTNNNLINIDENTGIITVNKNLECNQYNFDIIFNIQKHLYLKYVNENIINILDTYIHFYKNSLNMQVDIDHQ
jgi:hypothetical protein